MEMKAFLLDDKTFNSIINFRNIIINSSGGIDQVKEQISREPRPFPTVKIDPNVRDLKNIKPEHVKLENYDPHHTIKASLTVSGGFNEKDRKRVY